MTARCYHNTYVRSIWSCWCVLSYGYLQYNTTKRWADYLVNNALKSENQYGLL